jgi:hypothetical protein
VAVSREIKSTEGDVAIDFELERANNLVAKVVTPELKPAAGSSVAIGIAGSQREAPSAGGGRQADALEFRAGLGPAGRG